MVGVAAWHKWSTYLRCGQINIDACGNDAQTFSYCNAALWQNNHRIAASQLVYGHDEYTTLVVEYMEQQHHTVEKLYLLMNFDLRGYLVWSLFNKFQNLINFYCIN